jgi:preprotein translocase subunit SecE
VVAERQVGGTDPERRGAARPGQTIMALEVYKRGQGKYTRMVTFVAGAGVGVLLAWYVWRELEAVRNLTPYVQYGVPLLIVVGVVTAMYWAVNRPRSADFMIATEGEMKKVSWSTKKEIIGGTKVVIATTLILATLLWAVDLAFSLFFKALGVLDIGGD